MVSVALAGDESLLGSGARVVVGGGGGGEAVEDIGAGD